ncbi:nuclear transport factor 2 family protein [Nocardia sp. CA-120079]|uniref:nuclear transport factor 2 family protein n=1 Tax=Nocardia sp. CA-120079 TaxID=3239974 RepID=UPI003D9537DE
MKRLEDELAVMRLLTSYGPLADAGDADRAAELWSENGEYDVEGWHMRSRDEVRAMIKSDRHRALIGGGSAHFFGPPTITVDEDEALAVCESILVRHSAAGFHILRAGAHRIRLRRFSEGWRIVQRVTRPLNGSAEARALLASDDT